MNLGHEFDLLATAPEGIDRLRELILRLAVAGRLLPQNANDEPVNKLLPRIEAERRQLGSKGNARHGRAQGNTTTGDEVSSLPDGWQWVCLRQIADARLGKMLDKGKNVGSPYPYLRNTNVQWNRFDLGDVKTIFLEPHELNEYRVRYGDLLICEGGEPGRCAIWRDEIAEVYFQKALHRVRPYGGILPDYIALCLEIDAKTGRLDTYFTGATIKHFAGQELARYRFPLPPIEEQARIVAKVDELMRLCDELETHGRLEAEQHARMVSTLFDALAASESAHALAENWRRVSEHFDLLLDRTEAVDALEQTILELAVRGLLLPIGESDETQFQSTAPSDEATDGRSTAAPYELPASWSWVNFGEIISELRYGTSAKCAYDVKGSPVLRIPNLTGGRISVDDLKFGPLSAEEVARLALIPGDLLIVRSNGSATLVGSAAIVGEESRNFAFAGYLMRVRLKENTALPTYVLLALQTTGVRAQIEGPIRTTSGVKNINSTEVQRLEFALPPLEIQQHIVAHVGKLSVLCASLRDRIAVLRTTQMHFALSLVEKLPWSERRGDELMATN